MIRVARVVLVASLALWVGGLATISFVLAPTAFKVAPSRQVAGQIVGTSLRTFGKVEIACGVLAVASSVFLLVRSKRSRLVVGLTILMLLTTLFYVCWIYPAAADAREEMNRPPGSGISLHGPPEERFAHLHRLSVIFVGMNIVVGTVALAAAAGSRPDGP